MLTLDLKLKIVGCENNPEKSLTTKIGENVPCRYSISTIWGSDHIENKHTLYRGEGCCICGKRFLEKPAESKHYRKVRDPCHYTDK